MLKKLSFLVSLVLIAALFPLPAFAQIPAGEQLPKERWTDPIVLTGSSLAGWAVPADQTLEATSGANGARCHSGSIFDADGDFEDMPGQMREPLDQAVEDHVAEGDKHCTHNTYEDPDVSSQRAANLSGTPVDRLLGYRWGKDGWEQIPFQVDEMFTRYLSNNKSGFSFYSGTDQHQSYAFDREGFRWTESDPSDPCLAAPASPAAQDPVQGLDTDDELVFMGRDTGAAAPLEAPLPPGIQDSFEVAVTDPSTGKVGFAYVMRATETGPKAKFNATNGYVKYERDADADVFLYSQSSYDSYGAAPHGPWYDPATGICHTAQDEWRQRRPGDQATITTPRYRFRYEGRWLMTELQVANNDDGNYGPDLIDQWKARAFQQRPGGQTPCCGYEEEVNNWGGSSILMGERWGPVRVIRETWGADSGTNVVRREIFYRDEIRFGSFLRVHVIPPADGIYAQWDYNAGIVTRYYNQFNPDGVPIDGQNDEVFGNSNIHAGPDGVSYCGDDEFSDAIGAGDCENPIKVGNTNEDCEQFGQRPPDEMCIYNDIDSPDPTFSGVNAGMNWEQIAGPNGTLVTRTAIKQFTPGGTVQGLAAVPYYRDDSCFDDGTGSNPGPHLNGRNTDDGQYAFWNGVPRECWVPEDGIPPAEGDPRFWQGSIGTHGVHILLIADSDNAHTSQPLTEIDSEQRMVVLPGTLENVGEIYGRHSEKPLIAVARPEARETSEGPSEQSTETTILDPLTGQTTDEVTLKARLTSGGAPLANATLDFVFDSEALGSAVTDEQGVAHLPVTLSGPARTIERYTVSFDGSPDEYTASSAATTFEIALEDSALALVTSRVKNGYEMKATLTEADNGAALIGRTVRFLVNGTVVGTGTTDQNGVATFTAPKSSTKVGDSVAAEFDSDGTYTAATASGSVPK